MAKSSICITIDSHLIELARKRDINLSGIFNDYLEKFLEMGELKVSDIERVEKEVNDMEIKFTASKTHLELLRKQDELQKAKDKQKQIPQKEYYS